MHSTHKIVLWVLFCPSIPQAGGESFRLKRSISSPLPSVCAILPFGPKACLLAVALPRQLAKPWSPPVLNDPACDGLLRVWMRSWLCALPFSTSPITRSGINLGHFWLLDCLQLFHTPPPVSLWGHTACLYAHTLTCNDIVPSRRPSRRIVALPRKRS